MGVKGWLRQVFLHRSGFAAKRSVLDGGRNPPVNFRFQNASSTALRKDAEYAYKIGRGYLTSLMKAGISPAGLRAVEFGPGYNFGTALYLVCHGVKMAVADRFLSPWSDDYHPLFYKKFLLFLEETEPDLCLSPIKKVLSNNGYPTDVLVLHKYSLEDMSCLPSGICDVTLSNAVFEHLHDVDRAFMQLSRLTAEGGMGFHQVDHRDHRDFNRPLEYLIFSEEEFRAIFSKGHGECGNRMRPHEMELLFRNHGFEIVKRDENMAASPKYLKDFFPRLQQAKDSIFRRSSQEDLICISCQYVVRKTENPDLNAK